jgi:hypothetical protein
VSVGVGRGAIESCEPVALPRRRVAAGLQGPGFAILRRRPSLQPSRRAVLHVQAAGDPAAPADLADWFTERAFHFYLAAVRLPSRVTISGRACGSALDAACAELDAACARLRQAEGMGHVDALVLYEPELPTRPALKLNITCPVLVVTGPRSAACSITGTGAQRGGGKWPLRPRRAAGDPVAGPAQLGGHVTWLQLPETTGAVSSAVRAPAAGLASTAGRQTFFDELGRWLGAYMYGQMRDQLL